MRQQVTQASRALKFNREIRAVPPVGKFRIEWMSNRRDLVAQWLEESAQQRLSTATGQHSDPRFQGQECVSEFLSLLALTAHCRAERAGDSDAQEGGRGIRPVVHVFLQDVRFATRPTAVADKANRIDLQEQGGSAALWSCLGIENVGLAEDLFERMDAERTLM